MTMRRLGAHRVGIRAWVAAAAFGLLLGLSGCEDIIGGVSTGGPRGGGPIPASDVAGVQAFGSVVRALDGAVYARLDVLTLSGTPRYLSGISGASLTVGETRIPLVTGTTLGVFETSSRRAAALVYAPGAAYRFEFSIIDETGTEHLFRSWAVAPDDAPILDVPEYPFRAAGEPIDVSLSAMGNAAVIRVTGASGVTFDTTAVSDLSEISRVRPAMEQSIGPDEVLPGYAFPDPGTYRIEITSMNVLDAEPTDDDEAVLGSLSWFGAGTTTSATVSVE